MHVDTKETAFLQDLRQPSLRALSYILRHPRHWPAGFTWDFSRRTHCAMGLAQRLWNQVDSPNSFVMACALDISIESSRHIFVNREWCERPSSITPDMVADQIDNYLDVRAG